MHSSLIRLFCKTAECPTSEALLDYSRTLTSPGDAYVFDEHLAGCDFCAAELHLLSTYSGGPEECRCGEMPAHLRRLAEDLLRRTPSLPFIGLAELAENHRASH